MEDGSQTWVDAEKQGKGKPEGPGSVPETGGEHHGGQGGTGIKKPAQGSGWWLSGPRYLTHLPYSRGRCHNIGLEVTHASEACLLLGQRDDGSDEIDAPGPLGPFMFHGWARTTRLKVWPQIWAACVHPTMTTSIPSLIRSSPSPLGVPPSLLLPEHRPLTETTPPNQTIPANGGRRNGYKTRTSHPSWLSSLDNHSTREQAPFKGSVASWVAVVLFEPNLQPPTSNPHTTHTHTHTSPGTKVQSNHASQRPRHESECRRLHHHHHYHHNQHRPRNHHHHHPHQNPRPPLSHARRLVSRPRPQQHHLCRDPPCGCYRSQVGNPPPLTHAQTVTREFCFRGPHLRVLLSAATLPPRLS